MSFSTYTTYSTWNALHETLHIYTICTAYIHYTPFIPCLTYLFWAMALDCMKRGFRFHKQHWSRTFGRKCTVHTLLSLHSYLHYIHLTQYYNAHNTQYMRSFKAFNIYSMYVSAFTGPPIPPPKSPRKWSRERDGP